MVRHPQQKFVADPTMTRSNTKKKNKMKKSVGKQIPTDFLYNICNDNLMP